MKKPFTVIEPYRQRDHLQRNGRSHVLLSELLHCFPECAPRWWMRPDVPVPFWRYVFIDSGRCCPAVGGELVVCWFRGLDIAGIAFGDAAHSGFGPHRAGKKLRQCSLSAQGGDHQRGLTRSWRIIGQPCTSHGTQSHPVALSIKDQIQRAGRFLESRFRYRRQEPR